MALCFHGWYDGIGSYALSDTSMKVLPDRTYTLEVRLKSGEVLSGETHTPSHFAWTAPPKPTGVTARRSSESQINLTWTDNTTDETGYRVERKCVSGPPSSPCPDGDFHQVGQDLPANPGTGAMYFNDFGLTPDTTYLYQVTSFKNAGARPVAEVPIRAVENPRCNDERGLSKVSTGGGERVAAAGGGVRWPCAYVSMTAG